ncbi:plastocyanin/azurin family copper-binding protein [Aliamphritea spongicola]|uniref:plastocyanin/azurin family copper-binding protein n=1 Tax=Aliamphritea spongicola TaxID=707589 RepID=UPI00196B545F|nr:plastocyanin/azurin family copper-binding protein [Aliamphritea spongicola]MBN3560586.1 hypothetical protein [Aliamphritea spongicola]
MKISLMLVVVMGLAGVNSFAQEYEIGQKNKEFTVKELTVRVGDKMTFTNQDPFFHNIYSLSESQSFDLGSYPKGNQRSVVAEKPGTLTVECAIHPNMQMTIHVEE